MNRNKLAALFRGARILLPFEVSVKKAATLGIVGGVVVVLAAGGAGLYVALPPSRADAAQAKVVATPTPQFVSVGPLLVHLEASTNQLVKSGAYLQVKFELRTTKPDALATFKILAPAIRGRVLEIMLNQPLAVLNDPGKRSAMGDAVLAAVNKVMEANDKAVGDHAFGHIYITHFVSQPG